MCLQVPDQLDVAKRFGVGGYPLLLMFRHGRHYNYTGPREEDGEWGVWVLLYVNVVNLQTMQ